jgi:hypothetical protein
MDEGRPVNRRPLIALGAVALLFFLLSKRKAAAQPPTTSQETIYIPGVGPIPKDLLSQEWWEKILKSQPPPVAY